jgi:hypothetical protein
MLQQAEETNAWHDTLARIAQLQNVNGLICGRATRLLLESEAIGADEAAREMSLALSVGNDPLKAGAWAAGFLQGSGMILLLDQKLWSIVDNWIVSLSEDAFTAMLPVLRRTFATFPAPERRQMGERVASQRATPIAGVAAAITDRALDRDSAQAVLPLLETILFGSKA